MLSGLIWVQTVCKSYQQTTLVGNEFMCKHSYILRLEIYFLVCVLLCVHALCIGAAKTLARLRDCAGEPSSLAAAISTIISRA